MNSICCDLLRALDEVWCSVAWPLRSSETTWRQRRALQSLLDSVCLTEALEPIMEVTFWFIMTAAESVNEAEHTENLISYTRYKVIILTKSQYCKLHYTMIHFHIQWKNKSSNTCRIWRVVSKDTLNLWRKHEKSLCDASHKIIQ